MRDEVKLLRQRLKKDGLDIRAFVLMGAVMVWYWPDGGYQTVLEVYADFVGDAPERVHAELCRCLLAAGKEITPEQYFGRLRRELVWNANRVPARAGG